MLQLRSSRCAWCSGCCHRAVLVLRLQSSRHAWCRRCYCRAAVVSRSQSLCRVWFHGPSRCAAWASRSWPLRCVGVAIAIFVPRVVSRSRSLRCMGVAVAVIVSRGCRGRGRCAAWVSRSRSVVGSGRPSRERGDALCSLPRICHISVNYLVIYFRYFDPYRIYGTRNETMEHVYLRQTFERPL